MYKLCLILLLLLSLPAGAQKQRRGLGRLIRRVVMVDTTRHASTYVVDEEAALRRHDGKTIGRITIIRNDIFPQSRTFLERSANGIHARTREDVVRQDLLLHEGDTFSAATAVRGNRLLLSRPYISRATITAEQDTDDPQVVNLTIITFDSWTIGLDGGKYRQSRAMVEVYDENFLGLGTKVGVKSNFSYKNWRHGGEVVELETHNFLGSFFHTKVTAGHDFDSRRFESQFDKTFILLSDYEFGLSYNNVNNHREWGVTTDLLNEFWLRQSHVHLWGGKSWKVGERTGLYVTGHAARYDYPVRPDGTAFHNNPLLHDRTEALLGLGLYQEHFYSSTMIYGYGFNEYIATGHKLELVGGGSWQEFGDYYYGGANWQHGGFFRGGYLAFKAAVGSYFDMKNWNLMRSVASGEIFWFSNLWEAGTSKIRQFITLNYTQGWEMGQGLGSLVAFSELKRDGVRPATFRGYDAGRTRLLANTETVLFTRHRPLGFRMAVFGFLDAGCIGMDNNPFRNDFYGSVGMGLRFKNERLIFNAIQLRLGVSFGRRGFVKSNIVRLSTERRMTERRFLPSRVEVIPFD